jgi:hypothetical protein
MCAEEVELDDYGVVGVMQRDEFVVLVWEGAAALGQISADFRFTVEDVTRRDELMRGCENVPMVASKSWRFSESMCSSTISSRRCRSPPPPTRCSLIRRQRIHRLRSRVRRRRRELVACAHIGRGGLPSDRCAASTLPPPRRGPP